MKNPKRIDLMQHFFIPRAKMEKKPLILWNLYFKRRKTFTASILENGKKVYEKRGKLSPRRNACSERA
jgi:tmRNA-binding protein